MAKGKFVSYLRVSTDKQGRSGLGVEAQREAVARYLNGGSWKLVAEYVETESCKKIFYTTSLR
jgi:DNA invertase Pin-like site-specific DNA recombinase